MFELQPTQISLTNSCSIILANSRASNNFLPPALEMAPSTPPPPKPFRQQCHLGGGGATTENEVNSDPNETKEMSPFVSFGVIPQSPKKFIIEKDPRIERRFSRRDEVITNHQKTPAVCLSDLEAMEGGNQKVWETFETEQRKKIIHSTVSTDSKESLNQ